MLKRSIVTALCVFASVCFAGAAELRIGDASNGASLESLQEQALSLALSGKGQVGMRRILPSVAVAALKRGEFDIIVLDGRFAPEADPALTVRPYAAEALCVYVHPGNAAGSLTRKEVLEILTEPRPDWSKYSPSASDIQRVALKSDLPGGTLVRRMFGERNYAPEVLRVGSPDQLFVFLNPASAGFAPFMAERPAEVIALPIEDVTPSTATVVSGRYPLTIRYLIVTAGSDAPMLKEFLNGIFSPESRRKLADGGLIPLWENR